MTDKELLELAAKAAGYETDLSYEYDEDWGFKIVGLKGWWNPLTDDGDALRLAVKLGITDLSLTVGKLMLVEDCKLTGTDIVRRAIVRAAAEIGKTL